MSGRRTLATWLRRCALALWACLAAGCDPVGGAAPATSSAPTSAWSTSPAASGSTTPAKAATPVEGTAATLRETTLKTSKAYDTVRSLTDRVGHRLSGSEGDRKAVAWGLEAMREAGLEARSEPVRVPVWRRGAADGAIVRAAAKGQPETRHPTTLAALGGSVGTPAAGVSAEVVEVDSLDALDKLDPAAVKGKIVFFYVKTERTRDGSGYGRAVGVRGRGASRAAKLGAVGVVIRSIGTDVNRTPHTGMMRYEDGIAKIPAAALSVPDAEMLHRIVQEGAPVRFEMKVVAETLPDADSANVVGDLRGSSLPDEVVLLGCHLDSWDLGTGALDDASGCAIVLEAARQIALLPKRPRRTIRVVFFANEESGLAGAKTYAKAHEQELAKHVLALEADLGAGRVYSVRYLGGDEGRPVFGRLAALVEPLGVTIDSEDAHGGADLSPLRPAGVPIVDLRQDATEYFDFHHTANDTLDKVKKEDLDQVAAAYAAVAWEAADAEGGFGRIPEAKRERQW